MEKNHKGIKGNERGSDNSNDKRGKEQDNNPFRDNKPVSNEPSKEEEAQLEQQRKETLTERD